MPHAHCARNVDILHLCASQDLTSVNGSYHGRLVSFSWSSSRYIVGVDKEDIHRGHSSHHSMKVDTGADVTAISEEDYSSIRPKLQLDISRRILRGPDGKPLHILGAFNAPMSINSRFDRSSRHTVYVTMACTRLYSDVQRFKHFSTTSSSRQPISYDNRQSWLQEQCHLGLSPTLYWPRGNARNAAPYSLSRQCYTLLALYATSGTCPTHCQGGRYSRQNGVTRRHLPDR